MLDAPQADVDALLKLIAADPLHAADELDRLAEQFSEAARILRLVPVRDDGIVSVGALSDRVKIQVTSPDGSTRSGGVG